MDDGGSFYLPLCREAYITGNSVIIHSLLDINDDDTFDEFVILHEYFHFVEHTFSGSDSPGGEHSANSVVDPRLAHSEGAASYFAAAVLNRPAYTDHIRLIPTGGSTYVHIASLAFLLEPEAVAQTHQESQNCSTCFTLGGSYFSSRKTPCRELSTTSGCDIPKHPGEGHYREMNITRYLWDLHDDSSQETLRTAALNSPTSYDQISNQFATLWAIMTSSDLSTSSSPYNYLRSSGIYNKLYGELSSSSSPSWSSLQFHSKQASSAPFNKYEIIPLRAQGAKSCPSLDSALSAHVEMHPSSATSPRGNAFEVSRHLSSDHVYLLLPPTSRSSTKITIKYKKLSNSLARAPRLAARLVSPVANLAHLSQEAPEQSPAFYCPIISVDSTDIDSVSTTYSYEQRMNSIHRGHPQILDITALEGRGAPIKLEVHLDDVLHCPNW